MLADPLLIKSLDITPATAFTLLESNSFAMTDAGSGRSTRVCVAPSIGLGTPTRPATLSISHSVSNENNPVKTDRTLLRGDFILEDVNGKELKAYAYAVFGIPQGALYGAGVADQIALSDLKKALVGFLAGVLLASESASTFDETKITRVLAGES
jgi:hypothetical protein